MSVRTYSAKAGEAAARRWAAAKQNPLLRTRTRRGGLAAAGLASAGVLAVGLGGGDAKPAPAVPGKCGAAIAIPQGEEGTGLVKIGSERTQFKLPRGGTYRITKPVAFDAEGKTVWRDDALDMDVKNLSTHRTAYRGDHFYRARASVVGAWDRPGRAADLASLCVTGKQTFPFPDKATGAPLIGDVEFLETINSAGKVIDLPDLVGGAGVEKIEDQIAGARPDDLLFLPGLDTDTMSYRVLQKSGKPFIEVFILNEREGYLFPISPGKSGQKTSPYKVGDLMNPDARRTIIDK